MRLAQIVLMMVMALGIAGSGLAPAGALAQGRSPAEKADAVSKGVESPAERAAPALQDDKGAQDEARRRKKKQPKCAGKVATIRDHRGAIVGTAKSAFHNLSRRRPWQRMQHASVRKAWWVSSRRSWRAARRR